MIQFGERRQLEGGFWGGILSSLSVVKGLVARKVILLGLQVLGDGG